MKKLKTKKKEKEVTFRYCKAWGAPFPAVAIQYVVQRVHDKSRQDTIQEILDMVVELGYDETTFNFPMSKSDERKYGFNAALADIRKKLSALLKSR